MLEKLLDRKDTPVVVILVAKDTMDHLAIQDRSATQVVEDSQVV